MSSVEELLDLGRMHAKKEDLESRLKSMQIDCDECCAKILTLDASTCANDASQVHGCIVSSEKRRSAQRAAAEMRATDPRQNVTLPFGARKKVLADSIAAQSGLWDTSSTRSSGEDRAHAIAKSFDKAIESGDGEPAKAT